MSVRRVSRERWETAQRWEQAVWDRSQLKSGWRRPVWSLLRPMLLRLGLGAPQDDWNVWWAERFDNYRFLPLELDSAVELGCGPFTNLRVIVEGRRVGRMVCSDPLVHAYLRYPGTWLRESVRDGAVEVDAHPIEECALPAESFQLVVLINVLDHVRDADLCLATATRLVAEGGYLLVGQDLSTDEDIIRMPHDVGHPIRIAAADVRSHLGDFEPTIDIVLPREAGRNPAAHYGTLVFAGRRPPRADEETSQ